MGPTETLRPRSSRPIAVAVVVCCAVALVAMVVSAPGVVPVLRTAGVTVLVASLAWAAYWRPEVEVSDGGVRVVDPWRTVHVPWPALADVSERWSLTLSTTDGRRVSAFAAPARGAVDRGPGVAREAARLVTERRDALRAAGYLDDVRPEGAPVTVTLAVGPLVTSGAALLLLAASLVLPG
ncbi:MAG: PH domain-containing protein [Actinomycetales bacterium]|nr:PH domain-containing protein [Actinomycetales bacterium]